LLRQRLLFDLQYGNLQRREQAAKRLVQVSQETAVIWKSSHSSSATQRTSLGFSKLAISDTQQPSLSDKKPTPSLRSPFTETSATTLKASTEGKASHNTKRSSGDHVRPSLDERIRNEYVKQCGCSLDSGRQTSQPPAKGEVLSVKQCLHMYVHCSHKLGLPSVSLRTRRLLKQTREKCVEALLDPSETNRYAVSTLIELHHSDAFLAKSKTPREICHQRGIADLERKLRETERFRLLSA